MRNPIFGKVKIRVGKQLVTPGRRARIFLTANPTRFRRNLSARFRQVAARLFITLFLLAACLLPLLEGIFDLSKVVAQPPFTKDKITTSETVALQPFETLIKNTHKLPGLFTLYNQPETRKFYLEIQPEQLNKKFLCFITLDSGIGEAGIFSGLPLKDFLFQLRRQQNRIEFVIPNINFRTNPSDPQARSIDRSFSESILYSLPIKSIHPQRQSLLIDLGDLLMSDRRDLPGLQTDIPVLLGPGYTADLETSYLKTVKSFPLNVEIDSVYSFSGDNDSPLKYLPTLPDNRAFNLGVHYSLIEVPTHNGYRPRLADERVGYFLSAYKDLSNQSSSEPFVRYINRWHLEKQDPTAAVSPPVKPIVFWLENTVPIEYRDAIREGVLLWNQAFEQAGFKDAIQVKQMPDNATWDPADIRYNTIRWSSSFRPAFAGVGPSRVNPMTGEILDADIILDDNIVRQIKRGYRVLIEQNQSLVAGGQNSVSAHPCAVGQFSRYLKALGMGEETTGQASHVGIPTDDLPTLVEQYQRQSRSSLLQMVSASDLCFGLESSKQFAVGAMALSMLQNGGAANGGRVPQVEEYVRQYLRYLTAHEVGHTLGLRHNFHGSTLLGPEELNNPEIARSQGLTGSVMDYLPVNLAPLGQKQGDYFPLVVGPYDRWAIEYGYKSVNGPSQNELQALAEVAGRASSPQLSYATDEDTYDSLDPAANTFDLSHNMLRYSEWQLENARALWQKLAGKTSLGSEGYGELRAMFDTVFGYYTQQVMNTTLYVGGQSFSRDASGEEAAATGPSSSRLPFELIPVEKQREALMMLQKYVFAEDAFQFSPELLNKLAPSRWEHWGSPALVFPLDYPIGDRVTFLQRFVLRVLFSPVRLTRLRDAELKVAEGKTLTLPELFDILQTGIWTEILQASDKKVKLSSFRRSLQREHLNVLTAIVLRKAGAPEDARALAWYKLRELREAIGKTIRKGGNELDSYTLAHLEETRDRITKTLNAQLQSN
ncbi:MAG: zinc-dependent metalloprotease [Actinomycetota bacterium]